MSPRLKNQSEAVNESIATRSRLRTLRGRRQSARPIRNAAQKTSQTQGSLIFLPPNAPSYPRAIFHATCGPVHASVTRVVLSSTFPVAITPASTFSFFFHVTVTFQQPPVPPAEHFEESGS